MESIYNSGCLRGSPFQPVVPDLLIRALARGGSKRGFANRSSQILNSIGYSKVGVLYDTFDIFATPAAHRKSQWPHLVVRKFILSERVVIFGAFADQAWM